MKQWTTDIEKATIKNKNWRKVIFTTPLMQVVLMSVPPKQELGWEKHPHTVQFFRIEAGHGVLSTRRGKKVTSTRLKNGTAAVVPKGLFHNVRNTSDQEPLQLYTIYTPAHHPPGTIDRTHADEIKRTSHKK